VQTVEVHDGQLVAVHTGEGVEQQVELLRRIAGPGAPAVVSGGAGQLVTTMAPPLVWRGLRAAEVAAVVAQVADVLARAHAAGWVHGPLERAHVQGKPGEVLVAGWRRVDQCGPADDVAEVGRLLAEVAPNDRDLRALARRASAPNPPSMAGLATALHALAGPAPERRWVPPARAARVVVVGAVAIVAVVAVVAVAGLVGLRRGRPPGVVTARPATVTASTAPRPTTSSTPATVPASNGVIEHAGVRWRVGRTGDVVVLGDWDCDSIDTPSVLRPATGEVWSFARWPTGREPLAGVHLATVPGAVGARAVPAGRCDRLAVVDGQGRSTTVL
jgi:hypothetical protein